MECGGIPCLKASLASPDLSSFVSIFALEPHWPSLGLLLAHAVPSSWKGRPSLPFLCGLQVSTCLSLRSQPKWHFLILVGQATCYIPPSLPVVLFCSS